MNLTEEKLGDNQRQKRRSALRQAIQVLSAAGYRSHTVYFVGQHTVRSSDLDPDEVVLILPVKHQSVLQTQDIQGGTSDKANNFAVEDQNTLPSSTRPGQAEGSPVSDRLAHTAGDPVSVDKQILRDFMPPHPGPLPINPIDAERENHSPANVGGVS